MASCPSAVARSASRRAILGFFLLLTSPAGAQSYDFRLEKLHNPHEGATDYSPLANANFQSFARRVGAAMASANLSPPETLGHTGFSMTAELSVVDFRGGPALPTADDFRGPLLMPSFHVRKGLPWSFCR